MKFYCKTKKTQQDEIAILEAKELPVTICPLNSQKTKSDINNRLRSISHDGCAIFTDANLNKTSDNKLKIENSIDLTKLNNGNDGIPPNPKDLGILPTII